jgi:hypothetical protein
MDAVAKVAVMVNDGAGVDDAEFAKTGMSADNCAGEDDGAIAEVGGGGDDGVGVDEYGKAQADGAGVVGEAFAGEVVSDGDDGTVDAVDTGEACEFVDGAEDVDAVDLAAVEFDVVIDDAGEGADAGTFHEFEEDAGLSARTIDNDCHSSPAFVGHDGRRVFSSASGEYSVWDKKQKT